MVNLCPICKSDVTYYKCYKEIEKTALLQTMVLYCVPCKKYVSQVNCKDSIIGQNCKQGCDNMRYYEINGKKLPSVTSLLGLLPDPPGLENWKRTTVNYKEVGEKSMVVGTITHFRIENDLARRHGLPLQKLTLEAGLPQVDDAMRERIQVNFENYMKFYEQYKPVPIALEKTVYNEILGYAGTLDAIANINGKTVLLDFKTGKAIFEKYTAQLFAYCEALQLMGTHVDECSILRLGSNDWEYAENLEVNGDMLFQALEIYNSKKK